MVRGNTVLIHSLAVKPGAVALVLFKSVVGKCIRKLDHQPVPGNLGDDRRGCDGEAPLVPFAQAGLWNVHPGKPFEQLLAVSN